MSEEQSSKNYGAATELSFQQKVTAAYLHYVRGVTQSDIAIAMGGVNLGRVNEACKAIKEAAHKT